MRMHQRMQRDVTQPPTQDRSAGQAATPAAAAADDAGIDLPLSDGGDAPRAWDHSRAPRADPQPSGAPPPP
ncbi:MAG: hypothetical protein AAF772_12295, partial [Acidobacteriota bacterium]